jgi:hypothetical protein
MRRSAIFIGVLLAGAFVATPVFGSAIVGRDLRRPTLSIDRRGRAHVTWYSHGRKQTLLAWGAINARPPSSSRPQVKFKFRYGGGRGHGVCRPYDGPPLSWLVKACKAPDGSYWALQSWQRLEPNFGGRRAPKELHLSHWRGALPKIVIYQNWVDGKYRHMFGRFTYRGHGVFGFRSTPGGNPLDGYGRNVYIDTFDSAYGKGWRRENGFLTHHKGKTPGDFCYGFFKHGNHPSGQGTKYRATAEGPGVTPLVTWTGDDIGPYDQTVQDQMQALERSWGDPKCRQ